MRNSEMRLGGIYQYSMTEAFTTMVAHRFVSSSEPGMMPLGAMVGGSLVWAFEFGSLGFVWNLVTGTLNFHDFR